jgi:predicted anti-sigma-YlaC factor YlaD
VSADRFREKLIAYLDGELDTSERSELEKHLEKCYGCQRELEAVKSTLALIAQDAPPRFTGIEWQRSSAGRVRWWRWVWVPVAASVVLLAVVFGGDAVLKRGEVQEAEWVVIEGDSLSVEEGMELASLLIVEDETLLEGLEAYEEMVSADIYEEIEELDESEQALFLELLEEMIQGPERS